MLAEMAIHAATRRAARFGPVGGRVIQESKSFATPEFYNAADVASRIQDPPSAGSAGTQGPTGIGTNRTRRVGWAELYVEPLLLLLAAMSVGLIFTVVLRPPAKNEADFYVFWDAARWYREGVDPYLGHALRPGAGYNLNAPAFLLLFLPFSYLPLRLAFVAWTLAGLGTCWVATRSIAAVLTIRKPFLLFCGLLISQVTFLALYMGQVAPFLLPLFTWAWIADRRNRPWTAGLLLGVLIGAKPFLGVFGIYALLFRRSRPLTVGICVGAAALWVLGFMVGGPSVYRSWFFVLQNVTWPAHLANGSLLAVVTREFATTHSAWVTPIWSSTLIVVAGLAVLALRRITDRDQAWLLVGVCSCLLSPLGWAYYAPLLTGPVVSQWQTSSRFTRVWLALGCAFFCIPFTILVNLRNTTAIFLLGSAYTWGFLAWFVGALRRQPRTIDSKLKVGER